jgi:hypothetical protein
MEDTAQARPCSSGDPDRWRWPEHVTEEQAKRQFTSLLECKVSGFKRCNRGALTGWADVSFPALRMKIIGVAVFEKEGRTWAAPPTREYEQGGERKYAAIIEFDSKESKQAFSDSVLRALELFQGGGDGL